MWLPKGSQLVCTLSTSVARHVFLMAGNYPNTPITARVQTTIPKDITFRRVSIYSITFRRVSTYNITFRRGIFSRRVGTVEVKGSGKAEVVVKEGNAQRKRCVCKG